MPPAVGTAVRVRVISTGEEWTGRVRGLSRQGSVQCAYVQAVLTGMMFTFKKFSTLEWCSARWVTVDMDMEFEAEDVCSTAADEIIGSPRPQTEQAQAADSSGFYLAVDCS